MLWGYNINFTGNGALFTYKFRVASDATPGETGPITIEFYSARGYASQPRTYDAQEAPISLPNGTTDIARVNIVLPAQ